jgi:transposase
MEDVLALYHQPFDPKRPLVCMDESSKQLVLETRQPQPCAPGQVQRYDYEYRRNGVCNLFLFFAPLLGWRHLKVTARRTKIDWAHAIKDLVDIHFPEAEQIIVVMDNLNTHKPASLYDAFPAKEAKRLLDKLEFHYTPKHGSWLNMAEIEFSVLQRQALNSRIPDVHSLSATIHAWLCDRNARSISVNWRFSIDDARIKLAKLYPSF